MYLERFIHALVQGTNAVSCYVTVLFFLCLPITYAGHVLRLKPKGMKNALFLPLYGGSRHLVFQILAWGMWALSAAITLPVYLSLSGTCNRHVTTVSSGVLARWLVARIPLIPPNRMEAASGAAAVSSFVGELFMLKALLVFDRSSWLLRGGQPESIVRKSQEEWKLGNDQLLAPRLASLAVCLMGVALSTTGCVLLLALETMADTGARVLYCCLALSCVAIGASSTHGLGGHLRYCVGGSRGNVRSRRPGIAITEGDGSGRQLPQPIGEDGRSVDESTDEASRSDSGEPGDGVRGEAEAPSVSEFGEGGLDADDIPAAEKDTGLAWRFFQPFQGGSVFIATQAIGWTLFSATVVSLLLLTRSLVAGVGYCLRCWALAAGALMMSTQLVLGVSVLTFQRRRDARKLLQQPVLRHPGAVLARAAGLIMPVVMMYIPLSVTIAFYAAVFVLLPLPLALATLGAMLIPYLVTLRGYPAHTGCRRWEWLCRWFTSAVEGSLAWWTGQLLVVRDFEGTADDVADALEAAPVILSQAGSGSRDGAPEAAAHPQAQHQQLSAARRRYVLGFHPHGLYPTGAGFLPLMPSVQAAFPGILLVTLTASIVHYAPFLRDIAGWAGFRQVTRRTFRKALRDTGGVLLCPGGQAELVYADRAFPCRGSAAAAAAAAVAAGPVPVVLPPGAVIGAAIPPLPKLSVAAAVTPVKQPEHSPKSASAQANGHAAEQAHQDCGEQKALEAATGETAAASLQPLTPPPLPRQPPHQLVIYAGHQGFVRLALEEGAWLVPVLALGETLQLRNLIRAPEMQRATYKRIGFPLPFIIAGRWSVTTLPLRNPLVYVVGKPLRPPAGWEAERQRQLTQGPHVQHHHNHHRHHSGSGQAAAAAEQQGGQPIVVAPAAALPGLRQRSRRGAGAAASGASTVAAGTAAQAVGAAGSTATGATATVVVPQPVVDEYHAAFYTEMASLWSRYHHLHPVLRHAELVFEWGHHAPKKGLAEQPKEG